MLVERSAKQKAPKGDGALRRSITSEVRQDTTELYGIVFKNMEKPLISEPSGTDDVTAAAQLETGAIIHIGAAVASIRYASFALETLCLSVTGRITEPTVRQLK